MNLVSNIFMKLIYSFSMNNSEEESLSMFKPAISTRMSVDNIEYFLCAGHGAQCFTLKTSFLPLGNYLGEELCSRSNLQEILELEDSGFEFGPIPLTLDSRPTLCSTVTTNPMWLFTFKFN